MKHILLFTFVLSSLSALANPAPLPNLSYTGNNRFIQLNSYIAPAAEGGGQFAGTVAYQNQSSPWSTSFWCIDDQESFGFGDQGYANVTLLKNVEANKAYVRFATIGDLGDPNYWTNTLGGTYTAQQRFEMSAYLVSQYPPLQNNVNRFQVASAIQKAIWAITNNSSLTGGYSVISPIGDSTTNGYWIDQAINNYNTVDLTHWAIVSWSLDGNTMDPLTPGRQTFLVQVTPEPGFLGVLTLGMLGLFFFVPRRKSLGPK